ncbi:hypothetical protein V6000_000404 [Aspergillus fumigatus]|jgi:hypothetical protein
MMFSFPEKGAIGVLEQNGDRHDDTSHLYASLFSSPLPRSSMPRDGLPRAHDTPQTISFIKKSFCRSLPHISHQLGLLPKRKGHYMLLSEHCEPSPLYGLGRGVWKMYLHGNDMNFTLKPCK